jgi:hypothetical protein
MARVGFEPMIAVLKRAKAVHALDRAATVSSPKWPWQYEMLA